MKNILVFFLTILFVSCTKMKQNNNTHLKEANITKSSYLSLSDVNDSIQTNKSSLKRNEEEKSPIKVISATLFKSNYSSHRNIRIVFKNSGKKNIKAIKFEWSCINSFDEPANSKYFYERGKFKENSTRLLKSGQTRTEIWEDFSTDANEVTEIKAYYIVYTDGSKWNLYKEDPLL